MSLMMVSKVLALMLLTSHCQSENIHIGAVLSNMEVVNHLKEFVHEANSRLDVKAAGLSFNVTAQPMDANPIRSALSVCDDIITKRVHIMIASHPFEHDVSPISVSYTCGYYGMPLIGISARDSAFSDKNVHPTFMRTVPPYFNQAVVWVDLLTHFGWNQVIFVHGMDEEGRAILSRFQTLAEQREIKIEKTVKFSIGTTNFTELLQDVVEAQSRIVLLSAGKEDAEVLFNNAAELRIAYGSEYVWLVTEEAMKAYSTPVGAVGLELINEDEEANLEDSVKLIVDSVVELFRSGNMTAIKDTPDSCSTPMTSKWRDGMALFEHMKSMTIEGRTGMLQFTNEGDRLNSIYYIQNKQQDRVQMVGYHGNKESQGQMVNLRNEIVWPNGETDTPEGVQISTHLQVVTIESKPFVYRFPLLTENDMNHCDKKKGVNCSFTNSTTGETTFHCCYGYCMEMLKLIAGKVNFTYSVHLSAENIFGSFKRVGNGTKKEWTGMMGELTRDDGVTSDLLVAPLTINPERAAAIDFSKPFKYQGLSILVKKAQKDSSLASFLQPFTDTLWILVALSVHIVALVLYLLDRFSPFGRFKLAKNDDTEEDALNLSSAMWFAWGVLLNSGIGEGTPRSFSARVLGMVWAGFAMIIVASYTANLAAFLVLDRPDASISGIDDSRLRNPNENFRYATVKDSAVEMYFKRQVELSTMYRKMEELNYANADDAIRDVKIGEKLQAFIWDSSRLEYEDLKDCDLVRVGELFGRSGLGVGLKKGSPWTHRVSLAILGLHEGGDMEKLDNEWILVESTECPERAPTPATLGLTNMAGVFMMVAGGIVAGVFLIFVEILYKRHRGLKEKELELARNAADRWRGNIAKRKQLRHSWAYLRSLRGEPSKDSSHP
ncbi:glutamate [NMDA] receptor subunit 1-like isoform X2 [Dreissena polymorpha]|uniref:glutamate [NMDA] receptor subunit 1-like isoform X2 n=1 Tax=Dreissena polymorpha TaxID=45954 RepID=UPI0022642505|nr:glutamate [NMDA] receptor subunit 1-like isoform X2 [Dreissena polymorpha]